ncbi:MAG: AAA family ATPase [Caldilineaceae bacterium SB0665_bin_21]|nr:AAA family ATPase [Caldilineaceae bacterium SB0665_bin_21]
MTTNLSFPIRHLSARVPWHDNGWDGTVCRDPKNNVACLKLTRIAEKKNEVLEARLAGRHLRDLSPDEVPPCMVERVAFMSPYGLSSSHSHPYRRDDTGPHSHFRPTPLNYPAYSVPCVPFRWMLNGENESTALRTHYPLDDVSEELEPTLPFKTDWWQDYRNHTAILEMFWRHVKVDVSLVFFYAKQVPLVEDMPGRRILIGAGRVKSVGPLTEYRYDGPVEGKLRSMLWERMVGHSIRPGFEDGFLMPYHEALERSRDGDAFDPAEAVALSPQDRFTEFSYATEHVGDDAAIESLLSMRAALVKSAELFGADIQKQEAWIDSELGRLWRKRGPFPGMGAVLHACGVPLGNFIARALEEQAGEDESPWSVWYSLLDAPGDFLQPELARCIGHTIALAWKGMPGERRAFLELLSRVDLPPEQAKLLVAPEERGKLGIQGTDSAFVDNPYLFYEATRLATNPVSVSAVDRGLFPASSIRGRFPIPEPSRIDTRVDARRLRALSIRELEVEANQGDTLVPRGKIIERLRMQDHTDGEEQTLVTGDLLKVAEDTLFADVVRIVGMADGSPAYQLERLGQAGDLIRKTVDERVAGKRHNLDYDWRNQLDAILRDFPDDPIEAEKEELARREKAAALNEIANARVSVLIGSAGTGKTTLLSVLCKHPQISEKGIVLLAPTGKARVRMEDVICKADPHSIRAYTLAQFLIPSGRYVTRTQQYILNGQPPERRGRTVIVDECSMLTEEMLAALIESLAGVDRLILVGDPKQLPPIGAGRPFVDIIARLKPEGFPLGTPRVGPSYAELTIPRRQEAQDHDSLELAEWFGGEPGPSHDSVFEILSGHRQSETVKVVHWETGDDLKDQMPEVLAQHLGFDKDGDQELQFSASLGGEIWKGKYAYFDRCRSGAKAEAWQILSPSRQKPWGVDPLNRLIHQRYKSQQVESATQFPYRFFKPQGNQLIVYGDKVINSRNQRIPKHRRYPKEEGYLANGEVGIVVGQIRTRKYKYTPRSLDVEFSTQQGYVVKFWSGDFDEEGEADLELAYALTVHKAQGSEFDTVLLILPKSSHMLSRELIYTAMTRQKKKIVILMQGSPTDLQRLSSDRYSEGARRLTNLFASPSPVSVDGERFEDRLIHRTARGEAVRSKSEVIIANLLHAKGIAYRYEDPLEIDGITKYPDFTIEDDNSGKSYYWEHLGMLSDRNYRRRWSEKLAWLKEHGISPKEEGGGQRGTLITTEDSADGGIDSNAVSRLIEELF